MISERGGCDDRPRGALGEHGAGRPHGERRRKRRKRRRRRPRVRPVWVPVEGPPPRSATRIIAGRLRLALPPRTGPFLSSGGKAPKSGPANVISTAGWLLLADDAGGDHRARRVSTRAPRRDAAARDGYARCRARARSRPPAHDVPPRRRRRACDGGARAVARATATSAPDARHTKSETPSPRWRSGRVTTDEQKRHRLIRAPAGSSRGRTTAARPLKSGALRRATATAVEASSSCTRRACGTSPSSTRYRAGARRSVFCCWSCLAAWPAQTRWHRPDRP